MRQTPEATDGFAPREERFVKPGVYTVTLELGKEKRTQTVTVSGMRELSENRDDITGVPPNRSNTEKGRSGTDL